MISLRRRLLRAFGICGVLLGTLGGSMAVFAQTPPPARLSLQELAPSLQDSTPVALPTVSPISTQAEGGITQAACSTCGGSGVLLDSTGYTGCSTCGGAGRLPCYPGQTPFCSEECLHTGHPFLDGIYECICCPDPCYQGHWIPLADTAFFVASARPETQQRLRWDSGIDTILLDRAEFFWARSDGRGKGVAPPPGAFVGSSRVRYNDLTYYVEAATGMLGVVVETPYRSIDTIEGPHHAGFGDIKVGPKTMLFDCELLQVAMEMMTYTPSGIASKGLGTGHVSLEPSLLVGIKLGPQTYYQGQLSEWIPLGGDPDYAGAVLRSHHALNHEIFRFRPTVPLIATIDLNTTSFQDGAYTDPMTGIARQASGFTYVTSGAGLRLFVCDRIDFGFNMEVALTFPHLQSYLYTTEFRFRF